MSSQRWRARTSLSNPPEQWNGMVCLLAGAGYSTIAVDLPGFGKSTGFALRDDSLERQVDKLHSLMTRLHIEQFDVAGNSMGGAITALYASRYPRAVRSVAYIGSPLDNGAACVVVT